MALPLVTIVGRPNVGKSSLLNMLAGRRISIVDPTAGVTRDRIQALCDHRGRFFEAVDTGGYGIADLDELGEQVEQQIRSAVEQTAAILFVTDGQTGLVPLDQQVAHWLRSVKRPTLLLANKVDGPETRTEIAGLHKLGFGEPLVVSALHQRGKSEILDWIFEHLPPDDGQAPGEPLMKLAIVGRRNAGKSTFINALAGQERVIVSEIPGTTRDAVDVRFEHHGKAYMAIDTAGLRKKSKVSDDVEYYSFHRAELSVRRADVVLLMIDAVEPISAVDKRLGSYIAQQYKPCIIVVNKWDLAKEQASTDAYGEYIGKVLSGLSYAPVAFTTAAKSKNIQGVVDLAMALFKQARTRVPTAKLNEAMEQIAQQGLPRPKRGMGQPKILYATQIAVTPPTIVMFMNDSARATPALERFVIGRLRDMLPFAEVPIRLMYRGRRGLKTAREADSSER